MGGWDSEKPSVLAIGLLPSLYRLGFSENEMWSVTLSTLHGIDLRWRNKIFHLLHDNQLCLMITYHFRNADGSIKHNSTLI